MVLWSKSSTLDRKFEGSNPAAIIYNGTVTMAEAKHGMYTMTQILRESK